MLISKLMDKEDVIYMCVHISIYICMYAQNGILLSHKKKKMLLFATTWMDLDVIILNEIE